MNKTSNKIRDKIEEALDKIKSLLYPHLVASNGDPVMVRKKHLRLMTLLGAGLVLVVTGVYYLLFDDKQDARSVKNKDALESPIAAQVPSKIEINKLARGVTNEQIWMEGAEKKIEELQSKQKQSDEGQDQLKTQLDADKVSKHELAEILKKFEDDTKAKYDSALEAVVRKFQSEPLLDDKTIEVTSSKFKKIKRIGDYIPAGSYVPAKMISGVDVGVGVVAATDPRQVLLRVTGKTISAGYGKNYLSTDKLIGCIVQTQATGDLSSEKAYLKPVLMTCAINKNTAIEVPVKGWVTALGKVGIRGEIVSREGDLVTQSFFAGLVGGIGSGISQYAQPQVAVSGGLSQKQTVQDILKGGVSSGLSGSTNRLSDYLIKRAEQYQPVISINEGIEVHLVFQEGFSLNEEETNEKA